MWGRAPGMDKNDAEVKKSARTSSESTTIWVQHTVSMHLRTEERWVNVVSTRRNYGNNRGLVASLMGCSSGQTAGSVDLATSLERDLLCTQAKDFYKTSEEHLSATRAPTSKAASTKAIWKNIMLTEWRCLPKKCGMRFATIKAISIGWPTMTLMPIYWTIMDG